MFEPARLVSGDNSWPLGILTLVGRQDDRLGIVPDVDLTPLDPQRSVSRRHAEFRLNDIDGIMVRDLGSANGTFVGERRIPADCWVGLEHGATIRCADVALRLIAEKDVDPRTPAAGPGRDIREILDEARVRQADSPESK